MKKSFASYGYNNPMYKGFSLDAFTITYYFFVISIMIVVVTLVYKKFEVVPLCFFVIFYLFLATGLYAKITSNSRKIVVGSKYLIEGNSIIYYKNIEELKIDHKRGVLVLTTPSKKIIISKENFPTESQKEHKIRISQSKKFGVISGKIYNKIIAFDSSINTVVIDTLAF